MKEIACKAIRSRSLSLSHLVNNFFDFVHGYRAIQGINILLSHPSGNETGDSGNIPILINIVLYHDTLEMAYEFLLEFSSSLHLRPIYFLDFMDL